MQKISYNDIDFSKLKKLDVKSFENYIYVDDNKKNIYKILKEEDFGKLQDKSLKLDLLEEKKDATNISIPKLKIENNIFVGVIEDYIDGYDLCDINLNCKDINEIMNILIKNFII